MLTGLNKPLDFLSTVLANEFISKGFLTDEPLINDMCGLSVTQTGKITAAESDKVLAVVESAKFYHAEPESGTSKEHKRFPQNFKSLHKQRPKKPVSDSPGQVDSDHHLPDRQVKFSWELKLQNCCKKYFFNLQVDLCEPKVVFQADFYGGPGGSNANKKRRKRK